MDGWDYVSIAINVLTGGRPGEKFCSRVARNSLLVGGYWKVLESLLDRAFHHKEKNHCWECFKRSVS